MKCNIDISFMQRGNNSTFHNNIFLKYSSRSFQNSEHEHDQVWFNTENLKQLNSFTEFQEMRSRLESSTGARNKNIFVGIKYFLIEMNLDISIQID